MGQTPTIQARRAAVAAASSLLTGLSDAVVGVGNDELGPFLREVDDLSRQMEAARVALLAEALSRGVVADSDCPSAAAWVIQWAPTFRAGGAAQLLTVAHATRAARNAALAAAVLGARVSVRNAAVALAEMDKLGPRLRDEAVEAVWAGFVQVATDHGPNEIRGLRDQLIAVHGQEGEFARRQDQLKYGVSLSQPFDDDGMAVYRLRLDPEGKEVLEAILRPLSAPRPVEGCSDLRSPRPAPRRGPGRDLPARRRSRRGGPERTQSRPMGVRRAGRAAVWLWGRVDPGWAAAVDPDHPPDRLRRDDHPGGPGHRLADPGRGPGQTAVHRRAASGFEAAGQRLHHPRLYRTPAVGRRPPHHPLAGRRQDQPAERGTDLPPSPSPSLRWGDPQIAHQRGWTATATASEVTWHL